MPFAAPTNLTNVEQTTSSVRLTWEPGVSVDAGDLLLFYRVEGDELVELVGEADISVVGGGAVSSAEALFGSTSFLNPGTSSENNNYIYAEHADPYFLFPDEFTWEGWFYVRTAPDSYNNFFANHINFPTTGFIQLAITSGHALFFNASVSGGSLGSANNAINLNEWAHIAISRDYVDKLRLFVNGVMVASGTRSGQIGGGSGGISTFEVGRGHAGDNADIDAYFEEIRIVNFCRYGDDAGFTPPDNTNLDVEATVHAVYRDGVRIAVVENINEFEDTGLTTGTYTYKVAVWDPVAEENDSDYSNEVVVNIANAGRSETPIVGFNDEQIYQGYFGGHLKGTTIACPGENANKVKPCC